MMKKRLITGALALGATAALALTGCSGDSGSKDGKGGGESKQVTIGMFNWDEDIAVSNLWKVILEDKGYEVELETADPGPVFQGLADGDYDAVLDVWLPTTHKDYVDQYKDDIVEIGAWNDEAELTISVNADAPIDSLTELADHADEFDNQLIGIEPGAGLTAATEDKVIPTYGLEDMDFVTSSTPAMLSELKSKMDAGENVAVTLWKPHWANNAFDLKDLEDPENTLGDAESLYTYGSSTFQEDQPEVAGWLADFKMDADTLHDLENLLFNENDTDDYEPLIREWIADNQEYVDGLTA